MYCRAQSSDKFKEEDISSPLAELNLIRRAEDNLFTINTGLKTSLPQGLFISSIVDFWQGQDDRNGHVKGTESISVDSLLYGPSTPGRIFSLSESELTDRLHNLDAQTNGALSLTESTGLSRITKHASKYDPQKLLSAWTTR